MCYSVNIPKAPQNMNADEFTVGGSVQRLSRSGHVI